MHVSQQGVGSESLPLFKTEMKYDLNNEIDAKNFKEKVNKLFKEKALVLLEEFEEVDMSEMRYAHILFKAFGIEYGDSAEYVKEYIYKKQANRDMFFIEKINPKTGEKYVIQRSMSVLTGNEIKQSIARFKHYAILNYGIALPDKLDKGWHRRLQVEFYENKSYI